MGIGKWWLKHGPGSPGSMARAMVTSYRSIQARMPNLTRTQLLAETLESRYALAPSRWSIPAEVRQEILAEVQDQIVLLIVAVFLVERDNQSRLADWETSPLIVRRLVMEVIIEAVCDFDPDILIVWDADRLLGWSQAFTLKVQFGRLRG